MTESVGNQWDSLPKNKQNRSTPTNNFLLLWSLQLLLLFSELPPFLLSAAIVFSYIKQRCI